MGAQDEREGESTAGTRASRERAAFPISAPGRRRLLDTALRLLDERGVDNVSAGRIAQEAGHRNVAAVSYHYGDRRELLLAQLSDNDGRRYTRTGSRPRCGGDLLP